MGKRGSDVAERTGELLGGLLYQGHDLGAQPRLDGEIDAAAAGQGIPLTDVRIRPPLPKPGNIDCMAVNYMEDGTRSEPAPINGFHKSPNAVIGHGDTMVLPDVPALSETLPGYDASLWTGLLAPAGTPKSAIDRIHREVTKLLASPEVRKAYDKLGTDVVSTDPKSFDKFLRTEYAKWGKVVRDLKLKVR